MVNKMQSRRNFLKASILGAGALMAFHAMGKTKFIFHKTNNNNPSGVWDGSLITDRNALFDLPNCLKYKEVINSGDLMSDGLLYGGDPDGMEFFDLPDKKLALVINHETSHIDTSLKKTTAIESFLSSGFSPKAFSIAALLC